MRFDALRGKLKQKRGGGRRGRMKLIKEVCGHAQVSGFYFVGQKGGGGG